MDFFIRSIKNLSQLCGIVSAALIGMAIIIVCQMVVMRYGLNASTVWQTEFVIYSLVASTFIGSPYVLLVKGHVNVDLLPHYMGARGRYVLAIIANLLGLSFCAILTFVGFELFHEALMNNWTTDTIWKLPLWIPYISIPIGIGILSLQYVADILAMLTGRETLSGERSTHS